MSDWQERWDKMEETERRERDIGEKPDPCEKCGGTGGGGLLPGGPADIPIRAEECPRCRGTGVQP